MKEWQSILLFHKKSDGISKNGDAPLPINNNSTDENQNGNSNNSCDIDTSETVLLHSTSQKTIWFNSNVNANMTIGGE